MKYFSISFDIKKDKTWKIYITYDQDQEPCMKELEKIFGDNIFCYVELIQERVDDEYSGFLRGPKPGDELQNNVTCGTIGILGVEDDGSKNHYATTCYHVCFQKKLPKNYLDAHKILKEDYEIGSPECVDVTYQYTNEEGTKRLGTFDRGLYDNEHDIALIKLKEKLDSPLTKDCNNAITFLRGENLEEALLGEEEAGNKIMEKLKEHGLVRVGKFGSVTRHTEGELVSIDGGPLSNDMSSAFYGIRKIRGEENFAEPGDSGSLVYMICDGEKMPFAYLQSKHGSLYCCPNLKSGLEALNFSFIPCIGECSQ